MMPRLAPGCFLLSVAICVPAGCKSREGSTTRVTTVSAAEAAPGDVTPKVQPPQAAQVISHSFTNTAEAIRPSVVRLDVEVGPADGRLTQAPGQPQSPPRSLEDFLERFFDFGGGDRVFPPPGPQRGTGSGVIFDRDGRIVTNSHVVRGASRVTIVLSDGQRFDGKVVGSDPFTDIGVVRFEKKPPDVTVARLGSSKKPSDRPRRARRPRSRVPPPTNH